ncbi:MAG: peptidoglycan-binding domain-containing protein [Bryobacteraceae bacterium]
MVLINKLTAMLFAAALSGAGVCAQTATKKAAPAKALAKPVAKGTITKAAATKTATTKSAAAKSASVKTKGKVKPQPRSYGQLQPAPERYKEIQQALLDRGYFRGQVDGVWGPDSVDALKRFQVDQNLDSDGKVGSLSLIALGLGPRRGVKTDDTARPENGVADGAPSLSTPQADPPQDTN